MAKTEETLALENEIYKATKKQGVFACFEVTIGWFGHERVDFLTYDTNGVWRCYEIKVSVEDFHSPAAKTFLGNYNYFVMPPALYERVKGEIPEDIGVYVGGQSVKKAKRRKLGVDELILMQSMIRSLDREYNRSRKSKDLRRLLRLERDAAESKKDMEAYRQKYYAAQNEIWMLKNGIKTGKEDK